MYRKIRFFWKIWRNTRMSFKEARIFTVAHFKQNNMAEVSTVVRGQCEALEILKGFDSLPLSQLKKGDL